MKSRSLCSPRSGKPVANQHVIATSNGEMFKSYKTMIALRTWEGDIMLDHDWDYSATTLKYLKVFLLERWFHSERKLSQAKDELSLSKSEIQKRIDDGVYKIGNLN